MTTTEAARAGPEHAALVARLRAVHASGRTRPLAWRRAQLEGIARLVVEREAELLGALADDLAKPGIEAWATELGHVRHEVGHILRHLADWARPSPVRVRAVLRPARAAVVPEPLGVVLVVAPWNYPVQLLLLPLAYALAAGNVAVVKPSEIAPHTSAVLAEWLPRYVDDEAVAVVEGDGDAVTSLLAERLDHVFYTGNARVGRLVMQGAAQHLTPVTLELGGKSPVLVDRSANVAVAARRVAWGKWVNAGQTCVAPDYVLVAREVETAFVEGLAAAVRDFYGDDPATSADYGRIVTTAHWDRLRGLIDRRGSARVAFGGDGERDARYLAPTVLQGVSWEDPVMQEEIFGPVLAVLAVEGVDDALAAVNAHDKPLALYVFAEDRGVCDRVVAATSSGGVGVNLTLLQLAVADLPFGGVGASGTGKYRGKWGFDTFTHHKAVLSRSTALDLPLAYPPYTRTKRWLLRKAL